jgi:hypothetical protein
MLASGTDAAREHQIKLLWFPDLIVRIRVLDTI